MAQNEILRQSPLREEPPGVFACVADGREHTLRIQACLKLPVFPAVASKLVLELNAQNVVVSRIVELIECEPRIAAQLLQVANSPLYGLARPITSIGHAVVILGFRAVSQIALTLIGARLFQDSPPKFASLSQSTYTSSLAIATLARNISKTVEWGDPDEAFLTGVLHDIGKLVLLSANGSGYDQLLVKEGTGDITQLEREKYGLDHAGVGRLCVQHWGLPAVMSEAIAQHHRPLRQVEDMLPRVLISARRLAMRWQIGFAGTPPPPPGLQAEDSPADAFVEELDTNELQNRCREQFVALRQACLG